MNVQSGGQLLPTGALRGCFAWNYVFKYGRQAPLALTNLETHLPHMKDARLVPLRKIIHTETSTFSPPRSPRTREGAPYVSTAERNTFRTVDARLLLLALIAVT